MSGLLQHSIIMNIAIPLFGAFTTPIANVFGPKVRKTWVTAIFAATLANVTYNLYKVLTFGPQVYVLGGKDIYMTLMSGMVVPIRIIMHVDAMSAFMAFSGAIVAFAVAIYSIHFMQKATATDKYDVLLLLMTTAIMGLETTGDAFNFFVFLEIASISSVALVAFWRNKPESLEASLKYFVVGSIGALFVLVAIMFLYGRYDVLDMAGIASRIDLALADKIALGLLVISLAMKAGAVPMHMATPDAYSQAPASVTALLVSLSQASLYGLFRVLFTLFGVTMNVQVVGWLVIILGILSMFVGVTMALKQHDIKRLMAYHAVSQTGYMLLGVGVGLAVLNQPEAFAAFGLTAMTGGIFHIINHAMYKGLLFLTAGAVFYRTGKNDLDEMGGLAHNMKWTAIFFIIGAAAIAGIPPFNGFASKLLIYESVYRFNPLLAIIAMVVSILTLASFVKVFQSAFLGPQQAAFAEVKEVPAAMTIGMGILAVIVIAFGLFPDTIVHTLVNPAVQALVARSAYIGQIIGGGI